MPRTPRSRQLRTALLLPLCLAASCAAPTEGGPSGVVQAHRSINDGILETGEPSVVLLYHSYYGVMCTGTIIGRRVVLTAKHCVQNDNGQSYGASGWGVYVGTSPSLGWGGNPDYTVAETRATPGADIENSDIGIFILNQDVSETPYRYKFQIEGNGFVGSDALLIGYGQDGCPDGDSGTKYRTVDEVMGWATNNDFVTEGRGANHGDSGGPVFDPVTMEVIGVISRGGDCEEYPGITIAVRVDAWKDFINEALSDTGDCAPTSLEEVCADNLDNNCNGTVDEGCEPEGAACTTDEDCASRFCRDVGTGGMICSTPCDPNYGSAECSVGSYCKFMGCGSGACAPGGPGTLWVGEPCQVDTDCLDLMCGDPGTGTRVCMAYCAIGAGQCLGNEACAPLDQAFTCGGCVPDASLPGPFNLGERCTEDAHCRSGLCTDDGGFQYCSSVCAGESNCPNGFHCREARCVRGDLGRVGEPCISDEDCESELSCLGASLTDPGYCTTSCTNGETCQAGTVCDGVACALDGLPVGNGCTMAGDCNSRGCFGFGGANACTLTCDRRTPCPPLTVCVVADNGMTLCQPNRLPMVETPVNPKPKKDCSTGGSGGAPLLALGFVLLTLWRRRR